VGIGLGVEMVQVGMGLAVGIVQTGTTFGVGYGEGSVNPVLLGFNNELNAE
jgi:hypothetical protein